MSSILKVSEIQDPTNGNSALSIDSSGNVNSSGMVVGFARSIFSTGYSGSSGGEAYTNINASYTPRFSNSLIYVSLNLSCGTTGAHGNYALKWKMRRGTSTSSTFLTQSRFGFYPGPGNSAHQEMFGTLGMQAVDTPNTTSSVTYGIFIENIDGAPGWNVNSNTGYSTWTFMEIGQ